MDHYIALIHKDATSDFGVSFPDLPGCVTAGINLDHARFMAKEALSLHLAGMAHDWKVAPEASSLETFMSDLENRDPRRRAAPNCRYAERAGMNRSGFLAYVAKRDMGFLDRATRQTDNAEVFAPLRKTAAVLDFCRLAR